MRVSCLLLHPPVSPPPGGLCTKLAWRRPHRYKEAVAKRNSFAKDKKHQYDLKPSQFEIVNDKQVCLAVSLLSFIHES